MLDEWVKKQVKPSVKITKSGLSLVLCGVESFETAKEGIGDEFQFTFMSMTSPKYDEDEAEDVGSCTVREMYGPGAACLSRELPIMW